MFILKLVKTNAKYLYITYKMLIYIFKFQVYGRFGIFYYSFIYLTHGVIHLIFLIQLALPIQPLPFILHYLLFFHGYVQKHCIWLHQIIIIYNLFIWLNYVTGYFCIFFIPKISNGRRSSICVIFWSRSVWSIRRNAK